MENSRAMGVDGVLKELKKRMRIDKKTNMGAVYDVVRASTGFPSNDARKYALDAAKSLGIKYPFVQINGKGRETPVADAKTMIEIIWVLGGKKAKTFRRQCAEYIFSYSALTTFAFNNGK